MILRLFDAFCAELKFNMLAVVISSLSSRRWIQTEPHGNLTFKAAAYLILYQDIVFIFRLKIEAVTLFENFTISFYAFSVWFSIILFDLNTYNIWAFFLGGTCSFSFRGLSEIFWFRGCFMCNARGDCSDKRTTSGKRGGEKGEMFRGYCFSHRGKRYLFFKRPVGTLPASIGGVYIIS